MQKKGSGSSLVWLGALLLLIGIGGAGFFGYRYYVNRAAGLAPKQVAQAPAPEDTAPKPPASGAPVDTPPVPEAAPPPAQPETAVPPKPVPPKPRPAVKAPAATTGAASLPMAAAPQTPAPAPASPPPAPALTPRQVTPAPAPASKGPSNGLMLWSGPLPKGDNVVIDGTTPSVGLILSGALPGVPVNLTIEPKDVTVSEAPSAANGWKRFAFHAKKGRKTVVTIYWTAQ
ncbi:MAG TPA: hypothetical protein VKG25_08160 [Bryobacteraceae bacterium]|nr:hypothetical protein [Bryobacteraceae bacterium]